jgi:hypothetical protein
VGEGVLGGVASGEAGGVASGVAPALPELDAGVWFNFSAVLVDQTYFLVLGTRLHSNNLSV